MRLLWHGAGLCCVIGVLLLATPVVARERFPCTQLDDLNTDVLPQGAYLPPLIEDASYSITNPGQLDATHIVGLRTLLDRARCIAQTRRIPLSALRLTVFAHTDDRGAREHILNELRRRGVQANQLSSVGRAVVDVVAAWHRARVLVDRLREEVQSDVRADPALGGVDPVGMVQAGDLTSEAPNLSGPVRGLPPQPHPRSFLLVIALREGLAAQPTPPIPIASTTPPPQLPPIIQVSCCDLCVAGRVTSVGAERTSSQRAGWFTSPLGAPQLEVLFGAAVATGEYTRAYLYSEMAWLGLGLRLPIRRFEVGLRLSAHAAGGAVRFNDLQQAQQRAGAGAALQLGVQLVQRSSVRLILGAEVGWLYSFRRIERIDHPFVGTVDTKGIHAVQTGGWLRLDVPLPRLPRLALSAELSLGVIPFPTEVEAPANTTAKALGGITYALR